jgi:HEAT repeat protein
LVSDGATEALLGAHRALDDHRARLLRMFRHRLPHVRTNATRLLRYLVYERERTALLFVKALDDSEASVRRAAVAGLAWMRTSARTLGPLLEQGLRRSALMKRVHYALGLAELGAAPRNLVPLLVRALKLPDIRLDALLALERRGTPPRAAIPALHRALRDRDINVRAGAERVLRNIERR